MTRKGVWDLQDARDKDLQNLWAQYYTGWSVGENQYGQLGLGSRATGTSPKPWLGSHEDWDIICQNRAGSSNESNYQGAIKTDGTLWMWGNNNNGQLGDNSVVVRSSPVQVPGTTWANMTSACYETIAVKTDGTLWAWGRNAYGAMGVNQPTNYKRSSPVQVGSDTTWSTSPFHMAGGTSMFQAIKTDGTLWCWGHNEYGQLGQNNKTNYSSPKQVGSGTDWDFVGGVQVGVLAVKTDGTMWGWGSNTQGSLGLNNKTEYSSPKQIPGTNWSAAVCAGSNSMALRTDGTLWSWGNNNWGRVGNNQPDNYHKSSPEQLGADTTWTKHFGFGYLGQVVHAIKTDGTLWGWGNNQDYKLGLSDQTGRSSPTQIGTEQKWSFLSSNYAKKFLKAGLGPSQL